MTKKIELRNAKRFIRKHLFIANSLQNQHSIDGIKSTSHINKSTIIKVLNTLLLEQQLKFEIKTDKYNTDYPDIKLKLESGLSQKNISKETGISLVTVNKISKHFKRIQNNEIPEVIEDSQKLIVAYENRELNLGKTSSTKTNITPSAPKNISSISTDFEYIVKYEQLIDDIIIKTSQRLIAKNFSLGLNTINKISQLINKYRLQEKLTTEYFSNKSKFKTTYLDISSFSNTKILDMTLDKVFNAKKRVQFDKGFIENFEYTNEYSSERNLMSEADEILKNKLLDTFNLNREILTNEIDNGSLINVDYIKESVNRILTNVTALTSISLLEIDRLHSVLSTLNRSLVVNTRKVYNDGKLKTNLINIATFSESEISKTTFELLTKKIKKWAKIQNISILIAEDCSREEYAIWLEKIICAPFIKAHYSTKGIEGEINKWMSKKIKIYSPPKEKTKRNKEREEKRKLRKQRIQNERQLKIEEKRQEKERNLEKIRNEQARVIEESFKKARLLEDERTKVIDEEREKKFIAMNEKTKELFIEAGINVFDDMWNNNIPKKYRGYGYRGVELSQHWFDDRRKVSRIREHIESMNSKDDFLSRLEKWNEKKACVELSYLDLYCNYDLHRIDG